MKKKRSQSQKRRRSIKRRKKKETNPWKGIHPELKQFLEDQKNHNTDNLKVKQYYDFIRECNVKSTNQYVERNIASLVPEIKLTERFITQSNYAANTVSKLCSRPTEISGVCSGRKTPNAMYIDTFTPFHDQICSPTRTKASGKGMTQTYWGLHKEKKEGLAQAHSHNTMPTFHSPTDKELLKQGVSESYMTAKHDIHGLHITIPYFYNIVFNQFTKVDSSERDLPDIRASVRMPKTLEGKVKYDENIRIFEPKWKMILYKSLSEEDKKRLRQQIKERVRYFN